MSSIGSIDIFQRLVADTSLTALLDDISGSPAIFNDPTIPELFTGNKTVNIYQSSFLDNTLCYSDVVYTIDCRAGVPSQNNGGYFDSIEIQNAVVEALNRRSQDGTFFTCSTIPPIPPKDSNDNYNAPVEARIRKRI